MTTYSGVHGEHEFQQSLSLRVVIEDEELCEMYVMQSGGKQVDTEDEGVNNAKLCPGQAGFCRQRRLRAETTGATSSDPSPARKRRRKRLRGCLEGLMGVICSAERLLRG